MIQGSLLAELDLLAWQLRLRDGAEAAMPRSLKRQLMKSSRKAVVKAQQPGQAPAAGEESLVSSDSESKDPAGRSSLSTEFSQILGYFSLWLSAQWGLLALKYVDWIEYLAST